MNDSFGSAITASLNVLQGDISKTSKKGTETYTVTGDHWCLRVAIDPSSWLGLHFELFDEHGATQLEHTLNTDLYRPVDELDRMFYSDIEQEMVAFVRALAQGEILVGVVKGKPAMIVPDSLVIRRGRFFTSSTPYKTLEKAKAKGTFRPLLYQAA